MIDENILNARQFSFGMSRPPGIGAALLGDPVVLICRQRNGGATSGSLPRPPGEHPDELSPQHAWLEDAFLDLIQEHSEFAAPAATQAASA
ncbi:hypothetical protein [uncultured Jatrophihabitans sp.]|uniref:hypothetical protein n=1 Tax=uncultured Jatrophihabitans sp. TaxID=1610747 RepID=UPI0035CC49FD